METQQNPLPHKSYLIYDGSCGACTVFIGEKSSFFKRYGFETAALQEPWVSNATGLNEIDLQKEILLLDKNSNLYRGAEVYRQLCKSIWWLKPLYFLSNLPIANAIFDACYSWFAERRKSISKACGLSDRAKY